VHNGIINFKLHAKMEKQQIKELKPCPFCGGEADLHHFGMKTYEIDCTDCGVNFGNSWGGSELEDDLIKLWNTRPSELSDEDTLEKLDTLQIAYQSGEIADIGYLINKAYLIGKNTQAPQLTEEKVVEILDEHLDEHYHSLLSGTKLTIAKEIVALSGEKGEQK